MTTATKTTRATKTSANKAIRAARAQEHAATEITERIRKRPNGRGFTGRSRVDLAERRHLVGLITKHGWTVAEVSRKTKVSTLSLRRWVEELS